MKQSHSTYLPSLMVGGLLIIAACSNPPDAGRAPAELIIESVTDIGTVSQDSELLGRDGGYSVSRQDVSTWLFGDSFVTAPNAEGDTLLSNSWSQTSDFDASDGIDLSMLQRDDANRPQEFLPYTDAEREYNRLHRGENCLEAPCQRRYALWPGAVVDDPARQRSIIFYSKIVASPGDLNFYSIGQSIALWPYDAARPERPLVNRDESDPTILFPEPAHNWGNGALVLGEYLYAFACTLDDLVKPCRLARANLDAIMSADAWEYLADNTIAPVWSDNPENAIALFNGNDIISISYNEYLNRFIAIYSRPVSTRIEIRSAPSITGPWTAPVSVHDADPGTQSSGWVYDALAHAEYAEQNGRVQYITYSSGTGLFRSSLRLVQLQLALAGRVLKNAMSRPADKAD